MQLEAPFLPHNNTIGTKPSINPFINEARPADFNSAKINEKPIDLKYQIVEDNVSKRIFILNSDPNVPLTKSVKSIDLNLFNNPENRERFNNIVLSGKTLEEFATGKDGKVDSESIEMVNNLFDNFCTYIALCAANDPNFDFSRTPDLFEKALNKLPFTKLGSSNSVFSFDTRGAIEASLKDMRAEQPVTLTTNQEVGYKQGSLIARDQTGKEIKLFQKSQDFPIDQGNKKILQLANELKANFTEGVTVLGDKIDITFQGKRLQISVNQEGEIELAAIGSTNKIFKLPLDQELSPAKIKEEIINNFFKFHSDKFKDVESFKDTGKKVQNLENQSFFRRTMNTLKSSVAGLKNLFPDEEALKTNLLKYYSTRDPKHLQNLNPYHRAEVQKANNYKALMAPLPEEMKKLSDNGFITKRLPSSRFGKFETMPNLKSMFKQAFNEGFQNQDKEQNGALLLLSTLNFRDNFECSLDENTILKFNDEKQTFSVTIDGEVKEKPYSELGKFLVDHAVETKFETAFGQDLEKLNKVFGYEIGMDYALQLRGEKKVEIPTLKLTVPQKIFDEVNYNIKMVEKAFQNPNYMEAYVAASEHLKILIEIEKNIGYDVVDRRNNSLKKQIQDVLIEYKEKYGISEDGSGINRYGFASNQDMKKFNPVQLQLADNMLNSSNERNLILQAPTGSGKTFFLANFPVGAILNVGDEDVANMQSLYQNSHPNNKLDCRNIKQFLNDDVFKALNDNNPNSNHLATILCKNLIEGFSSKNNSDDKDRILITCDITKLSKEDIANLKKLESSLQKIDPKFKMKFLFEEAHRLSSSEDKTIAEKLKALSGQKIYSSATFSNNDISFFKGLSKGNTDHVEIKNFAQERKVTTYRDNNYLVQLYGLTTSSPADFNNKKEISTQDFKYPSDGQSMIITRSKKTLDETNQALNSFEKGENTKENLIITLRILKLRLQNIDAMGLGLNDEEKETLNSLQKLLTSLKSDLTKKDEKGKEILDEKGQENVSRILAGVIEAYPHYFGLNFESKKSKEEIIKNFLNQISTAVLYNYINSSTEIIKSDEVQKIEELEGMKQELKGKVEKLESQITEYEKANINNEETDVKLQEAKQRLEQLKSELKSAEQELVQELEQFYFKALKDDPSLIFKDPVLLKFAFNGLSNSNPVSTFMEGVYDRKNYCYNNFLALNAIAQLTGKEFNSVLNKYTEAGLNSKNETLYGSRFELSDSALKEMNAELSKVNITDEFIANFERRIASHPNPTEKSYLQNFVLPLIKNLKGSECNFDKIMESVYSPESVSQGLPKFVNTIPANDPSGIIGHNISGLYKEMGIGKNYPGLTSVAFVKNPNELDLTPEEKAQAEGRLKRQGVLSGGTYLETEAESRLPQESEQTESEPPSRLEVNSRKGKEERGEFDMGEMDMQKNKLKAPRLKSNPINPIRVK